jgi:hypothetical protein
MFPLKKCEVGKVLLSFVNLYIAKYFTRADPIWHDTETCQTMYQGCVTTLEGAN